MFGPDFFAPLFHRLFPDREFSARKMSVPSATALLSYVRLSYPAVKQQLEDAIKLGHGIQPNQMALLKNLQDLFEYFIPIVSHFCDVLLMLCCNIIFIPSLSQVFKNRNFITLIFYYFLSSFCLYVFVLCLLDPFISQMCKYYLY